jgi:hypothetical protein
VKRKDSELAPELEALVKPRWIRRRAPDSLRARVDVEARVFMAESEADETSFVTGPVPSLPHAVAVRSARRSWPLTFALAASVAFAAGVAGAVTTVFVRSRSRAGADLPPKQVVLDTPRSPSTQPTTEAPPESIPTPRPRISQPKPHRPARSGGEHDPYVAEVALLQRAHAAYERRDFSWALALMEEHHRRFPEGRLAEEREALRVRALARSGRTSDARRAAAAFSVRFPRSIFLPRIKEALEPSQ